MRSRLAKVFLGGFAGGLLFSLFFLLRSVLSQGETFAEHFRYPDSFALLSNLIAGFIVGALLPFVKDTAKRGNRKNKENSSVDNGRKNK